MMVTSADLSQPHTELFMFIKVRLIFESLPFDLFLTIRKPESLPGGGDPPNHL